MNLSQKLLDLSNQSLLRQTESFNSVAGRHIEIDNKTYLNFVSNNYLGLNQHPEIIAESQAYLLKWGTGSSGSRLLGGSYTYQKELEEELAQFKNKEAALIFNSGYSANLALASIFGDSKSHVFMDKFNHASLYDGIKLGEAKMHRYKHNDMNHLELLLSKNEGDKIIISESLFSMDGDFALLEELAFLSKKYQAKLFIDEAHAESIYGREGRGLLFELDTAPSANLILGAFGKGYGAFGAYIAGDKTSIDYMINKARSFIYTTALPPACFGAIAGALKVSKKSDDRREHLKHLSSYLRQNLLVKNWNLLNSQSHIIPLIIGDNEKTLKFSQLLREAGFWVQPIREPTVPKGTSRIRINLNYDHSYDDLDLLINAIENLNQIHNFKGDR